MTDTITALGAKSGPKSGDGRPPERLAGILRIAIGFVQGVALYLLVNAAEKNGWPATSPTLFIPLIMLAVSVPVILIGGLGQMRWKPLLIWAAIAALVIAGLGLHDALRMSPPDPVLNPNSDPAPSMALIAFGLPALFIAHHLFAAASVDRRLVATYPRYFDLGWTSVVQIGLSVAFVGVMWIVLMLGAQLFKLIGIRAVESIVTSTWFAFPVSCVTFAAAIHITDIRSHLVVGARALALGLLSWLMPVMALFVALFILALPFTGLQPLWSTRSAGAILLASAAALVALINAAYQDGDEHRSRASVLRIAALVASATILPLVLIAGYSIMLRVGQHGLTPQRIGAIAAVVIALVYAVGYLATLWPKFAAMRLLERTNIAAAFASLGVFLLLFTPIADPARIAVDDQMARLAKGKIEPETFDFYFLRWQAGRYGEAALEKLKAQTDTPEKAKIAKLAEAAEKQSTPYNATPSMPASERLTLFPAGRTLPADFPTAPDTIFAGVSGYSNCISSTTAMCDVFLADIDGDGTEEVLLAWLGEVGTTDDYVRRRSPFEVIRKVGDKWTIVGSLDAPCDEAGWEAMRAGQFSRKARTVTDVEAAGSPMAFRPMEDRAAPCER